MSLLELLVQIFLPVDTPTLVGECDPVPKDTPIVAGGG
jgi:hypothetical protein